MKNTHHTRMQKVNGAVWDDYAFKNNHKQGFSECPFIQQAVQNQMNCLVYFIQCGISGPIKIGLTNGIINRISDIQVCNPYAVELIGYLPAKSRANAIHLETKLHRLCSKHHRMGEWFEPACLWHIVNTKYHIAWSGVARSRTLRYQMDKGRRQQTQIA